MTHRWAAVALLALAACGLGARATSAPPALPEVKRWRGSLPHDSFWEPAFADVRGTIRALDLPAADEDVARIEGAARVWDELGGAGRERLKKQGLVVLERSGDATR